MQELIHLSFKLLHLKNFKKSSFSVVSYFDVKEFDGTKITRAVKITGNSLDNKISGGAKNDKLYGGAGNDTLIGGSGNDTLTGGAGNDVFVYSAGNDVIADYKSGDSIYFDGASIQSWKASGKNIIFTTDSGTLTVKNGKGKNISVTTNQKYENIAELFEENDFADIDSIVDNKFAVAEFENYKSETTQENLITFAK